jgi:hypothetical protein
VCHRNIGREEVHTEFWGGNLNDRDHLHELGVDGRITLNGPSRNRTEGVNYIDLDQDRYRWRAFVNTVMNFRVP